MADAVTEPARSPLEVKPKAAEVVAPESLKLIITAGLAFAAAKLIGSETAMVAVLGGAGAIAGIIATAIWGVWTRLQTWRALKFLAGQVPDDVAVVGRADR